MTSKQRKALDRLKRHVKNGTATPDERRELIRATLANYNVMPKRGKRKR